jgi:hypothetical protein
MNERLKFTCSIREIGGLYYNSRDKLKAELSKAQKDYTNMFPGDGLPLVIYNRSSISGPSHEELLEAGFIPVLKYRSPHIGSPAVVTMYIYGDFELCGPLQPPKPSV